MWGKRNLKYDIMKTSLTFWNKKNGTKCALDKKIYNQGWLVFLAWWILLIKNSTYSFFAKSFIQCYQLSSKPWKQILRYLQLTLSYSRFGFFFVEKHNKQAGYKSHTRIRNIENYPSKRLSYSKTRETNSLQLLSNTTMFCFKYVAIEVLSQLAR